VCLKQDFCSFLISSNHGIPVAKVVTISSDSIGIEDWFVVFEHHATGKIMGVGG